MNYATRHPETIGLHGGQFRKDPATNAVAVPIYQTTSYQFDNAEHAQKLFALQELGNIYTRIMNPTTQVLEERLTALEGGVASLAVASGSAAVALAIQNLAKTGDNIVTSPHLYGGTYNLFTNTLRNMGIEVRFADPESPESFTKATDKKPELTLGKLYQTQSFYLFLLRKLRRLDVGWAYHSLLIILPRPLLAVHLIMERL